jgi:hypothetical protein
MEQVRSSDGDSGSACFDGGKAGVIVHCIVSQKNFLPAPAAHVQG